MSRLNIGIVIFSEHRGFLISLAKVLVEDHNQDVTFIFKDNYCYKLIQKHMENSDLYSVFNTSNQEISGIRDDELLRTARTVETELGIKLSQLVAEDRGLGQGYFTNVLRVPEIKRSRWSHRQKLMHVLRNIHVYEKIIPELDVIIMQYPHKIITSVARKYGKSCLCLVQARFGDRYMWSDNDYLTSSRLIDEIKRNLKLSIDQKSNINYKVDAMGDRVNKGLDYRLSTALERSVRLIFRDIRRLLKKNFPPDSYYPFGWLKSTLRKRYNYKYVKSISVSPGVLSDYRLIYFPLNLEPEISLFYFSPEFTNALEAIVWLSKSARADTVIVVKDHGHSFAVRSRQFYTQLTKMGNVMLADPDIHSWEWIKAASIVSTITGTVGVESIYMSKPVISFGKHQIINYLPMVKYVSNFDETNAAVDYFLNRELQTETKTLSKVALFHSQMNASFELPEYTNSKKNDELVLEPARKAVKNLMDTYREIFGSAVREIH